MTNFLLAKPNLPKGTIDCSVGEAHIVREALLSTFNILPYYLSNQDHLFEYHQPQGYQPLVNLLENKYQAPVIITNGAKNALCAVMYALKQMGKTTVSLPNPYWCLLPPIIETHGLNWKPTYDGCDAHLLVSPNNPTGETLDPKFLVNFEQECRDKNIPIIHDAVYYNHIYLPTTYSLNKIGDVQIYSASKLFGLSGIRMGWLTTSNTEFYKLVQYYMEMMTVGVSIISQIFLYDLLNRMNGYPSLTQKFEELSAAALLNSKKIVKQIDPQILEVPNNIEDIAGMFLWSKVSSKADFNKAKVNPAYGEPFGIPGYVRINLALPEDQMIEIVKRLNSVLE